MSELLLNLIQSEIDVGFALVLCASLHAKSGQPRTAAEGRAKAERYYTRARAYLSELPEELRDAANSRLIVLRDKLDDLPVWADSAADVKPAPAVQAPTQAMRSVASACL
jgi:hypothetical protein